MIRYLEEQEKMNIRPLYEQCFPEDTKAYTDYYFEQRLPGVYVAVNEDENQIVSALHLIPKTVITGRVKSRILYIYGVCTDILYRNKGYMKKMFAQVLEDMYQEKEPFTYIIPSTEANAQIYQAMGFSFVMDRKETKPEEQRRKPTHSLISRKAEKSDLVRLSIFAQTCTEKYYDVTLCRDVDYFRKMMELTEVEGGFIEIYIDNKVIVGYRIWLDDEVLEEVLDESIQNTMSWLETKGKPYAMARIVNLKNLLRRLKVSGEGEAILKITDPIIQENNGYFQISFEKGVMALEKKEDVTQSALEIQELTIGELTAHIFGYKINEGLPKICSENGFYINDYV
ncbi:MAG: GNAT family N-acetyltransferase [Eubacterium sp.]|nr:GNAT family N-acetyltransferase [Eubacterium sp.]